MQTVYLSKHASRIGAAMLLVLFLLIFFMRGSSESLGMQRQRTYWFDVCVTAHVCVCASKRAPATTPVTGKHPLLSYAPSHAHTLSVPLIALVPLCHLFLLLLLCPVYYVGLWKSNNTTRPSSCVHILFRWLQCTVTSHTLQRAAGVALRTET